jgi:hypothetical protein
MLHSLTDRCSEGNHTTQQSHTEHQHISDRRDDRTMSAMTSNGIMCEKFENAGVTDAITEVRRRSRLARLDSQRSATRTPSVGARSDRA